MPDQPATVAAWPEQCGCIFGSHTGSHPVTGLSGRSHIRLVVSAGLRWFVDQRRGLALARNESH
jgi:hypothetical protein